MQAQDKSNAKFGKVTEADFNLSKPGIIDDNTNAVIIADEGSTSFIGNNKGWVSYVFKKHIRIKIIN
ncbi:MAG TPA: hypothetical protein VHZ50_18195, partial [Puia sp.]|nr:hypothetical protein [Puia sp.]